MMTMFPRKRKHWLPLVLLINITSSGAQGRAQEDLDHWSFRPIETVPLPDVMDSDWVKSPLDRFILSRLEAEQLVFLTDVGGVMDGGGRVIPRLDRRRANILFNSGVIQGGMIPKLSACLRALERSPVANIIDGRRPDALLECVRGNSTGTTLISDFRGRQRRENTEPS